jgi:RNA polymerase sigma factor for flagellar operon FliA
MDLVDIISRAMQRELGGRRLSFEEMRSYGQEALLKSARSFDPTRGVPFRRWANLRIRGSIIDGLRTEHLPRRLYEKLRAMEKADQVQEAMLEEDAAQPPRDAEAADARLNQYMTHMATAMAVSLVSAAPTDQIEEYAHETFTAEDALERAQLVAAVREAIATRAEGERRLLELYYFEGKTLDEAGKVLGLSKSWCCRLHARAIEGLTKELKRKRMIQL